MRLASLGIALGIAVASSRARAQAEAGASFLRIPIGARLVGLGGAGVADPSTAASPLANPAALVRLTQPAGALDYGQDAVSSRFFAFGAVPSRVLGTAALGGYLYNPGEQPLTDVNGTVTGTLLIRDIAVSASYAVMFGRRFGAGLTYKYVQNRFDCTGACTLPARAPSTGAIDFGVQYDLDSTGLHFGAVLRNAGLRLQIKDRAQADPLPTQVVGGVAWDVPNVARYVPDATLRVLADASRGVGVRLEGTAHLGVEATYRKNVAVRVGYSHHSGYSGPTIGFGLLSKRFSLDVARQIVGEGPLADKPPTYLGLRYAF